MIDTQFTIEELNVGCKGNMSESLGIEFTQINETFLEARMPVDRRTIQPIGILNGGASAALAETVGSLASFLSVDRKKFYTVGLEIKCNHISSAFKGFVYARATPEHIGRSTQVWQIRITGDEEKLVCLSILSVQVMPLENNERAQEMLKRSPLNNLNK